MKLKKLIIGLAVFTFIAAQTVCMAQPSQDSAIRGIINQYKGGNYLGCIDSSNKVITKNPSNIFAYYYKALAYTQLGKKEDAQQAFEKVISLNSNSTLVEYAKQANACISSPEDCAKYQKEASSLEQFIKSNKFYDTAVQSEVNQKKLDRIRENINDELGPKKSEMPTNDEIAGAVKTLAQLGINPLAGMNNAYANPQMMQMSMLLGDNTASNNSMNMLPMMLMNQNNGQSLSPELIQTMMMNQMSPAL